MSPPRPARLGAGLVGLALALFAAPSEAAAPPARIIFLPDTEGPTLVLDVAPAAEEGPFLKRRAEVAVLEGETGRRRRFADRISTTAPGANGVTGAPHQLVIEAAPGDGLLVTISDLGEWQAGVERELTAKERSLGPPVASPTAARLVLGSGRATLASRRPGTASGRATLYGTERITVGRALVVTGAAPAGVVATGTGALEPSELAGFVVDVQEACGQVLPRAVLGTPAPTRLRWRLGTAVCLGEGAVLAPITGTAQGPQGDEPLRGLLVDLSDEAG